MAVVKLFPYYAIIFFGEKNKSMQKEKKKKEREREGEREREIDSSEPYKSVSAIYIPVRQGNNRGR